ncbi:DUF2637 domain-containing protein [Actinacidiphila acidipaludis]|uniref:DUF2637 domain-containing protein n=1 Tax=Actinacidiphila acidipaludis TaxID=2873382 RepID=A0ABS7Q2W2_9ACTN|nr:DUF2637 domain-containing protein [Streptomyces acidipaludis]MBY8877477.1 DUF2637 domain-containing protein [Streptomyces acidipaludis]
MSTDQTKVPPLTRGERALLAGAALLGVGVGGVGLAMSFDTVSAAGARWGFATPQMLPVGIDLAIPVFTVVNLLLIRMDMALSWVRWVPWFLTGVTCWLNIAAGHSLSAKVAHGTMPLLWVVLSEVAAHVYAVRIGAVTGRRMEKIRRSRWVLAPITTFALWRRMTLWEITSYTDALARERKRQLARADLRQKHGRRWRSQTDRRTRVLLKLGELAPAVSESVAAPVAPGAGGPEAPKPTGRRRSANPAARPKPGRRTFDDVLAEARTVTGSWPIEHLTADRIRQAVQCGAAHARTARDVLRGERGGAEAVAA